MTDEQLASYYAGLLILQYLGKAKAYATMKGLAGVFVNVNNLVLAIRAAYSVDDAVGPQLDTLGAIVGAPRKVRNFTGLVTLGDDDYRILIKIKIALNFTNGSLADIDRVLHASLDDTLRVFDFQNMHIAYSLDSDSASLNLAEALIREGFLPKPMGVEIGSLTYLPHGTKLWGFRRASHAAGANIVGFDTAATLTRRDGKWLTSEDVIAP